MMPRIAVLGAGLAGLSAAWNLATHGCAVEVFERDTVVGGLAKSVTYQGFTFDIGPHRFLASQDSRVLRLVQSLLGSELQIDHRQSRILMHGTYVAYPLQASSLFAHATLGTSAAAIGSFLWNRVRWHFVHPPASHFERWMINRFGRVLYEAHFRHYTTKLWGLPPTEISADWAAARISQLTLWDILRYSLLPSRQTPRTAATTFHYPVGGIGTIAGRLAQAVEQHSGTIALQTRITGLETQADRVVAVRWQNRSSGRRGRSEVDGVVSTIPLPHLARMCPQANRLTQAIAGLRYRSMVLVNLLIKRDWVTGDHWLYVPERQYLFNRISEPKRFSAAMAPPGYTSLCVEITCDAGDDLWHADPDQLIERVISSLHRLGLLYPSEVCSGFVIREPHEYPIYTLTYRRHRETLLAHLRRLTNLQTTGRQGLFQYNNMDQAMEMGLTAADTLLAHHAPSVYTLSRREV